MLSVLIKIVSAIAILSVILMLFQAQAYFNVHKKLPPRDPKSRESEAADGRADAIPTGVEGAEVE